MMEILTAVLLLPFKAQLVLFALYVVTLGAVVLLAKWGLISREAIERVMTRIEETQNDGAKGVFKDVFDEDTSPAGQLVKTLVNQVDPKKPTPSKARRFWGFVGRAAVDLIPVVRNLRR